MKWKELTKIFMMILNLKKTFGVHYLYNHILRYPTQSYRAYNTNARQMMPLFIYFTYFVTLDVNRFENDN